MKLTFPTVLCILTDLACQFLNSFRKVFGSVNGGIEIPWKYCIWHFEIGIVRMLKKVSLTNEQEQTIILNFLYCIYARNETDFQITKVIFWDCFKSLNAEFVSKKNNIIITQLHELNNYFKNKFSSSAHWAYWLQINIPFGVNTAIERYHQVLKGYFENGRPPRIDKIGKIILKIEQEDAVRRSSFKLHPKEDNYTYRVKK